MIPQLGIVYDDLRLGLREGRSSTELQWPPAKIRVWDVAAGWIYTGTFSESDYHA
jgi:hypothetical protein